MSPDVTSHGRGRRCVRAGPVVVSFSASTATERVR
jgi:hypothetical protein